MAIGLLAITDFRTPFIDYTIPCYHSQLTFMIASKFSTHEQHFDITKSDYKSMALLMVIAFFFSVIICIITKHLLLDKNAKYASCWSIYQCFVQKGTDDEPSSPNLRILFVIWLFAGLITVATTGGELVAILAGSPPNPINTIHELAEATDIKIYINSKPVQSTLMVINVINEYLQQLVRKTVQYICHLFSYQGLTK